MRPLTPAERRRLRGLAHPLEPLIHLGKEGLSEGAVAALDRALSDHELVKVRFPAAAGRAARESLLEEAEARLACARVGAIGHVAILFRQNRDPQARKVELGADLWAR